ncbi:RDD family protein [Chitinilyticum piscinae]|uniref:RDD family protein n=1 Tax=Chitinilyticum piscinae TaxID=2866724 RepID=A0A8J7FH96_9NEIS|nr:RDD family protein [Chitinilyticum piscinae]MBE9609160.1 RDD family protein [Chitinilyticum piscinae]
MAVLTTPEMCRVDNPYAAPQAALDETPKQRNYVLASPARRLAAAICNQVMGLVIFLIGLAMSIDAGNFGPLIYLAILLGWLALQCHSMLRNGQSIAKGWLALRVVRNDGSHCDALRYILAREMLPLLLIPVLPLLLMFISGALRLTINWYDDFALVLLMVFSGLMIYYGESALLLLPGRQALHDRLCDTIVIREDLSHA